MVGRPSKSVARAAESAINAAFFMTSPIRTFLGTALALVSSVVGTADPHLFRADATNGVITISESDSAMLDLLDRAIRRDGEFAALAGTDYTASITFLGLPNSIGIDLNAAGTAATLSIPSINFQQDFTGADEEEIRENIRDFLKREGADIIARLRKVARSVSAASVTDGNPDANTATAARAIFFSQGLTPAATLSFGPHDRPMSTGGAAMAVTARTATMDIAGEDYTATQLRFSADLFSVKLSDRVRLEMPISADYVEIAGTEIYGAGAFFALPVTVSAFDADDALGWRLTPVAGGQTRVSFDAVSGAITWFGGLVSSIDYRVNSRLIVSLVNQASYHEGLPIALRGFTFESDVNQVILKNGFRLLTPLMKHGRAGIHYVHTDFLHEAAIDAYHTAGVSIETPVGASVSLAATFESDWADGYTSVAGRLQLFWHW